MSPHETHSLPWRELLIPQIVNFTIFFGVLVYFLRKPLRQHFSGKNEEFEGQRKKAEEARVQAERENFDIRNKLRQLEETAGSSLDEAKREAQDIKEKSMAEAKILAEKINEEAGLMTHFELFRAVNLLKQELVINATQMAEKNLTAEMTEKMQSRLNEDFLSKIEMVKT